MDASQIVLTAEGRKKLEEELAYLEGEKAKEIVEHIKEARAFGDLSENAESDAAKEDQASNVTLVDGEGEASVFTIVGTTETNVLEHKISNESPVGRAIIGHAEGESVEVVLASGKKRVYTIAKISR